MTGIALAFDGSHIDGDLYRSITDEARHAPHMFNDVVTAWTSYGLGIFALLMLAAWWRARRTGAPVMARALAVPVVVGVVFAVDSVLKSLVREDRPCQTLANSFTLEACPAHGDWSFPSNHAVIAFSAAAALWLVDRRIGALALPAAVLMAASRVWVGVHYPHDVAAGALVGIALAIPLTLLATRAAPLVERARGGRLRTFLTA
ncbi:phosphatase PAP2 family protein [Streptomyces sp. NPDC052396]|uniref:phosphatase PAP2 family protein n=1 Tax=Streptomyces sp. NPDC052396 TaxID=3365689 RepID=UPI0037D213A2